MADASGGGEYLGILWAELPVYILILLGWAVARGRVMDPKLSLPPLNTCARPPPGLACLALSTWRQRARRTDARRRPRPRAGS